MVWPGSKKNGKHAAVSSSPINGETNAEPETTSMLKKAGPWIAIVLFLGSVAGAGIAGGKAMERKAEKVELEAVRVTLSDATARARAEYDARLDRLEQERADHAATLRAINDRLRSIDDKLNHRVNPRRTP